MIDAVYGLTLRSLLLQKRTIVLVVVALTPVLMALAYALARSPGDHDHSFYSDLVQQLFVPTVAALVSLVFGVSAFGDEREDGTILYLVATPQARLRLVVAKVAAAWTASLLLLVPSLIVSGALSLRHGLTAGLVGWPLAGVVLASLAYCAGSVLLSLYTRRPIVIGVLYIILWEGSIATFAASAAKLSISAYGRAFVGHVLPQAAPPVSGTLVAGIVLVAVSAATAWFAARALGRVELP
ncbi:MAG TPA: ABC transporter permease [Gaiellales bacterium]|nr:ABC transporter permease [Gaiellales bacterium]